MTQQLPTGTVTFLFTDIEGSTRLLDSLGAEKYAEVLEEHRRLIRSACAIQGGIEVDTQGDAFFFAFPTAAGASDSAQRITDGLTTGSVRVRIGLHTGVPLVINGGYVGGDIHLGARVAASGHGGQVLLTRATGDLLDGDVVLKDLGEHRLKDIPGPVAIFQLGPAAFPPLRTISNTNLPRPPSSFVGRERELTEVIARIRGGARLVTLTGPGGSGKTRLAIEAASGLIGDYKAGVFWVGLAAVRDEALVVDEIAQTIGARAALVDHIGEREMLLVLDNLEQVIQAAPELGALLNGCPNLSLLVTSRELLRIQGEVEFSVPPLAVPEAAELFCRRAQLERSPDIVELCTRLDSLPLAVELAAARARVLSPSQILERISGRLDLLRGGRDADPRQRTLRATVEWSHDLLLPDEQRLFRRLSIFAGGCTLAAVEAICDGDLDVLQSLLDKSLLRFVDQRYVMLETIREFAAERLEASDESAHLRARHAEFYANLVRPVATAFPTAPGEWGALMEDERDNLRAAIAASLAVGPADFAYELANAYAILAAFHGPVGEGRSWLEAALEMPSSRPELRQYALQRAASLAQRQGDLNAARPRGEEALRLAQSMGNVARVGSALLALGIIEHFAGNLDRSEALEREAIRALSTSGSWELGLALGNLGYLLIDRGKFGVARDVLEEALIVSRAAGDGRAISTAASNLGHVLAREGRTDKALALQREALVLAHAGGDVQGVSEILLDVALIAAARSENESAVVIQAAVEAVATSAQMALPTSALANSQEVLARLRDEMDPEGLRLATALGARMTVHELVDYSLKFIDAAERSHRAS